MINCVRKHNMTLQGRTFLKHIPHIGKHSPCLPVLTGWVREMRQQGNKLQLPGLLIKISRGKWLCHLRVSRGTNQVFHRILKQEGTLEVSAQQMTLCVCRRHQNMIQTALQWPTFKTSSELVPHPINYHSLIYLAQATLAFLMLPEQPKLLIASGLLLPFYLFFQISHKAIPSLHSGL